MNTNSDHVMVAVENRWTDTFDIIVMLLGLMIYKFQTKMNTTFLKTEPIAGIDTWEGAETGNACVKCALWYVLHLPNDVFSTSTCLTTY